MTTVATDGKSIAADTLSVDAYGLKGYVDDKIKIGKDFSIGFAGSLHLAEEFWNVIKDMELSEVLLRGNPNYDAEKNDGPALICDHFGGIWYMAGSVFKPLRKRGYHAIGSGRDFALAAMHLGKHPRAAVEVARLFDVHTGGEIVCLGHRGLSVAGKEL